MLLSHSCFLSVQTTHECIHIPSQKALEPPCQLHIYISIIYIKAIPLYYLQHLFSLLHYYFLFYFFTGHSHSLYVLTSL